MSGAKSSLTVNYIFEMRSFFCAFVGFGSPTNSLWENVPILPRMPKINSTDTFIIPNFKSQKWQLPTLSVSALQDCHINTTRYTCKVGVDLNSSLFCSSKGHLCFPGQISKCKGQIPLQVLTPSSVLMSELQFRLYFKHWEHKMLLQGAENLLQTRFPHWKGIRTILISKSDEK